MSMEEIESLKKEMAAIKERNRRVEKEKAWETSLTRRFSIVVLTYLVMITVLMAMGNDQPFTNAIIPTVGYLLSTLSIGAVKTWWVKKLAS